MKRVKHLIFWLVVIGIILLLFSSHVIAEDDFHRQRYALVEIIKAETMTTRDYLNQESLDERVLDALLKVPRHEFVPDSQRPYAYANRP
ncbi:MAG: protein-L-isoaspartate O-methyltransferase, partial [Methylobacter sp.]